MTYNTDSCACRRVDSLDAFMDSYQKGDYFFEAERGWLWIVLPNGHHAALPIRGRHRENPLTTGASWEMSGTEDAPTLSPSIDNRPTPPPHGHTGWHGFLTNGLLSSC